MANEGIVHRFGDTGIVRKLRRAVAERGLGEFLFDAGDTGNFGHVPFVGTRELAAMCMAVRAAYLPHSGSLSGVAPMYLPPELVESGTLLDLSWPTLAEAESAVAADIALSRRNWEYNVRNPHFRKLAAAQTDHTGDKRESRSLALNMPRSRQYRLPKNRDLDGAAAVVAFNAAAGALVAQLRDVRYRYMGDSFLVPGGMSRTGVHDRRAHTHYDPQHETTESRPADAPDPEDLEDLGAYANIYARVTDDGFSAWREQWVWIANPTDLRADVYVRLVVDDRDADFGACAAVPEGWLLSWTKLGRAEPHSIFRIPVPTSAPALPRRGRTHDRHADIYLQHCLDFGPYWEFFPAA